jgi:hypothetical protein
MGNGHDHVFFSNKVFIREVTSFGDNFCTSLISKARLNVVDFFLDDRINFLRIGKDFLETID